ncbi:MAG TPA: phage tail assembly protein [Croceicoccus sp.]|nr:phage tail assembly protein [Croceicoccus sp.]
MTEATAPAETLAAETPAKPRPHTITLAEPITRESGADVTAITLRKPKAGELRGLSISNLVNSDAGSLITLLPRIAEPFITEAEAADLSAEDFAEIGGTIVGFFMSAAQKQMIAQMAGIATPSMP